ncbi:MAG: hypothetical protein HKN14_04400 [Marinicaulis sp.]|nr:hypothetical protein [Marinicaulis sp.]NNE40142.1 hypothetical protein [Marinicaulis sp.]
MTEAKEHREKRIQKLQIMVADSEIEEIDDWRFTNRAASRAAAIRQLIFLGMEYWSRHENEAAELIENGKID